MKHTDNSVTAAKRRRLFRAASLWLLLLLSFFLLRLIYLIFGIGIPCPLHAITGLYCPGCGMFRAAGALLHGDLGQAVRYNALCPVLLPLLFIFTARETIRYIQGALPAPANRLEIAICVGVAGISVLYAIARNLPPFDMLRP